RLKHPANDITGVETTFRARYAALYKDMKVYSLKDKDATKDAIKDTLKKAADAAGPNDTLVVFAAGHGVILEKRYYFLSRGFEVGAAGDREAAIRKGGVPADEVAAQLVRSKCLRRVLVLDTCHAGGAVEDLLKTSGTRDPLAFRKEADMLA